ncbi:MAG TPA: hypothetical protein VLH35_02735 [Candidatus Acidoferrales bacterium]|nr:hypothetical protein [Candidatus Acidoferrales bacterium]
MADPYRKLRRQIDRKKRKEHFRQLKEDQLLDIAYRGLTIEQVQHDEQLKNLTEWLNKPYK